MQTVPRAFRKKSWALAVNGIILVDNELLVLSVSFIATSICSKPCNFAFFVMNGYLKLIPDIKR